MARTTTFLQASLICLSLCKLVISQQECSPTCQNGGSCLYRTGYPPVCDCANGFTGVACEQVESQNPCEPNPCQNGGTCNQNGSDDGFICSCGTGFKGQTCTTVESQDPCAPPNPCQNGGTCNQDASAVGFYCSCAGTDFTGQTCTTDDNTEGSGDSSNECDDDPPPCLNGGKCLVVATNTEGFECDCINTGYHGPTCADPIPQPPGISLTLIIVIPIISVAVTIIVVLVIVCVCRARKNASGGGLGKDERDIGLQNVHAPNDYEPKSGKGSGGFNRNNLVLYEQLGSGAFAVVHRATAKGIIKKGVDSIVAVKMLKELASTQDQTDFLKEVDMYKSLTKHPNVITMLGCCIEKEPMYIIMEYATNGNLQGHLQKIRKSKKPDYSNVSDGHTNDAFLTPNEILGFGVQIARGMEYLASEMCVHRDLATRNILLGDGLVCKVSDFGLAREMANDNMYEMKSKGRVPVRWMALESLQQNIYSSASDIWSFGVLLWELVTLGSHPYPGWSSQRVIAELQKGYRLPKPEHCSQQIYDIMMKCWLQDPEERPTFSKIRQQLEYMLEDAQGYLVMHEFKQDDYVYLQPDQHTTGSIEN